MNEHPTPWRPAVDEVFDSEENLVLCVGAWYSKEEATELTQRIVTAVNERAALVAQRDELRAVCEEMYEELGGTDGVPADGDYARWFHTIANAKAGAK